MAVYATGAVGSAGIAVLVDVVTEHATVILVVGHYPVAKPVALNLEGLWFIRDRWVLHGVVRSKVFDVTACTRVLVCGLLSVVHAHVISTLLPVEREQ